MPSFDYENKFIKMFGQGCVGVDEVGRGCLAGPVVACCAYLMLNIPKEILNLLNDSKVISAKKRQKIVEVLPQYCYYEIAEVSADIIDEINILQASLLAMQKAFLGLHQKLLDNKIEVNNILIDGNKGFSALIKTHNIVDGDAKSFSIAAASILAKVYRDELMKKLGAEYPAYLWHKNAGYGTKDHLFALQTHGVTKHHRKTFAPVKKLLV